MTDSRLGSTLNNVTTCLNQMAGAVSDFDALLPTRAQTEFVNAIANVWYDERAVRVITTKFIEPMNELLNSIHTTFDSIGNSINSAATAWANTHEAPGAFSPVNLNVPSTIFNGEALKTNLNGDRAIDPEPAKSALAKLTQINAQAIAKLQTFISAAQNSGFIGGGQQETLVSTLTSIKTKINNVTNEIYSLGMEEIDKAVQEYGQLAQQVKTAYEGTEGPSA